MRGRDRRAWLAALAGACLLFPLSGIPAQPSAAGVRAATTVGKNAGATAGAKTADATAPAANGSATAATGSASSGMDGGGALNIATAAKFDERPATREILQRLRQGGYVLYLRHGYTDNSRPDRMPAVDLNDCTTQRPLTEGGRTLAAGIGDAMRKAGIPVGEFRISPLCRVKETAAAAFPGRVPTIDHELMYTANLTTAQKVPILANTRRLISQPVAPGTNRLLMAHAPNLMDLIGYFPKEGTLVIFLPKGEKGFEYVASIPPGLWPELLH